MTTMTARFLLGCLYLTVMSTAAFAPLNPLQRQQQQQQHRAVTTQLAAQATNKKKKTLDDSTTWRLRFALNDIPTQKGRKLSELLLSIDAKFLEDMGYEPPSGSLEQINTDEPKSENDDIRADTASTDDSADTESTLASAINPFITLNSQNSRWQLSEDPNDRKDSLWIWGLFEEPLYPFLLLQLETNRLALPDGDAVQPLKLFCQLNHQRSKQEGVILSSSADVTVRIMETVKADPFGAASVDIYEEVKVGRMSVAAI